MTKAQCEQLANLLHEVFLRLRAPGYAYFWSNKEELGDVEKLRAALDRSVAYAEAFHNLPKYMLTNYFDFDYQIRTLECFVDRAPELQEFVERLKDIERMPEDSGYTH